MGSPERCSRPVDRPLEPASTPHAGEHVVVERPPAQLCPVLSRCPLLLPLLPRRCLMPRARLPRSCLRELARVWRVGSAAQRVPVRKCSGARRTFSPRNRSRGGARMRGQLGQAQAPATHLMGARPGQACAPRGLKRPVHRPGAALGRPRQRPSSAPLHPPSPSTGPPSLLCATPCTTRPASHRRYCSSAQSCGVRTTRSANYRRSATTRSAPPPPSTTAARRSASPVSAISQSVSAARSMQCAGMARRSPTWQYRWRCMEHADRNQPARRHRRFRQYRARYRLQPARVPVDAARRHAGHRNIAR